MRLDRKLTRESALAARKKAIDQEHTKLVGELRGLARRDRAAGRKPAQGRGEGQALDPQVYAADQAYRFTKAAFDAELYKYEDALANRPDGRAGREEGSRQAPARSSTSGRCASRELKQAGGRGEDPDRPHQRPQEGHRDDDREADGRVPAGALRSSRACEQDTLFNLRNSPILDMVNPSLRVQQVQLPDHFINVNFMRIPRVDRCTTCHVAADRKGFEDPRIKGDIFRTHPRMHRMVGSESMHPANVRLHALPRRAGPRDVVLVGRALSRDRGAEGARGPRSRTGSSTASTRRRSCPSKYAEAGCYRCHARETNFPEAPNARRRHADRRGPRVLGLPPHRRPREAGPAQGRSLARTSRREGSPRLDHALGHGPGGLPRQHEDADLLLPRELRRRVRAPQARRRAAEDERRGRVENDTMVNAIVAYLYDESRPADVPPVAGRGDAARGADADRGTRLLRLPQGGPERPAGPDRNVPAVRPEPGGRRVQGSRDWIYHWIRDPKAWNPDTKMPNLRLTEADALDIAEYLATLKAPAEFDGTALPKTDEKTLDAIALYFQMSTKTLFDAKAELAKMDLHAQGGLRGPEPDRALRLLRLSRHPGLRGRQADRHRADGGGVEGRPPPGLRVHPHPAHAARLVPDQAARAAHLRPGPRARLGREAPDAELPPVAARARPGRHGGPRLPAAQRRSQRRQAALAGGGRRRARPADRQGQQLPGLPRHRGFRRLVPLARRRHLAGAADHPGGGREGPERLAVRLPPGARRPARSGRGSRSTCRPSGSPTPSSTT